MKNLLRIITLLFGFSQSQSNSEVYHHYYDNGVEVSENEFNAILNKPLETPFYKLNRVEFVQYMAKRNVICL